MCIPERGEMNPISLALKLLADQERSAFKEKNFELKRKKYVLVICHLPCTKFKCSTGHREIVHKLKGRREAATGIAPWQIL